MGACGSWVCAWGAYMSRGVGGALCVWGGVCAWGYSLQERHHPIKLHCPVSPAMLCMMGFSAVPPGHPKFMFHLLQALPCLLKGILVSPLALHATGTVARTGGQVPCGEMEAPASAPGNAKEAASRRGGHRHLWGEPERPQLWVSAWRLFPAPPGPGQGAPGMDPWPLSGCDA